jgi:DNA-binding GntR family transcriptional regulator
MATVRKTIDGRKRGTASAAPRYLQVANELIRRIATGKYPIGSNIPTETELSQTYDISRHTVREALRRVHDAGLISRRRRSGTEVVAKKPPTSYKQPINSIKDLLQYAEDTRLIVRSKTRVKCNAALAELLACNVGREWLRVDTMRVLPGDPRPVCLTTSYLNIDLKNIDEHVGNLAGPVSAMLEAAYNLRIVNIEQSIQAVRLKQREAKLLRIELGSPALRAVRRYYDERQRLLELSDAIHPGDRFTYVTRLRRE